MKHYLTTSEACDILGVDVQTIIRWIHAGELEAEMVGGRWKIPLMTIEAKHPRLLESWRRMKAIEGSR